MSVSEASYFEARRSLLTGFHRRVHFLGSFVVGPITTLVYLFNVLRHPSWQAYVLVSATVAMNLLWAVGFRFANRGNVEVGSVLVALGGICFCGFALALRENQAVAESVACLGLLSYVALVSKRFLLPTMIAGGLVIFLGILLPYLGLLHRAPTEPVERVVIDLIYVLTMFPVTFMFLRAGQAIGEELFRENEGTSQRQLGVLQKVQKVEPSLASAVSRIQQTATSLSARAGEQSAASSEVHVTSGRLMQMVAASAEAALDTRVIAEKTRDDSVASIAKLRSVEEKFQQAVSRIDAVRANIDELAERTAKTEEINQTLGDIAEHLKMLGINASLEAARAGEKGEGFQVVAQELRRMVQQSGLDLENSRKLLAGIRQRAAEIARDAEVSTRQLQESFNELRTTGVLVQGIAGSFARTSEKVDSIAQAAEQQRSQIEVISSAMKGFERATIQLGDATSTLNTGVEMITGAHRELQELLAAGAVPPRAGHYSAS